MEASRKYQINLNPNVYVNLRGFFDKFKGKDFFFRGKEKTLNIYRFQKQNLEL